MCGVPGPFDALNFYIPMTVLNEYGSSEGLPKINSVACSFGKSDPVIENLGGALIPFVNQEELPSRLFLDEVHQALCAHLIATYTGTKTVIPRSRGGLGPWQKRRAEELLNANLFGDISLADVAACLD